MEFKELSFNSGNPEQIADQIFDELINDVLEKVHAVSPELAERCVMRINQNAICSLVAVMGFEKTKSLLRQSIKALEKDQVRPS